MAFDAHANLASTLLTNSPGTGGTSITVTTGTGALFPVAPFNCLVCPASTLPTQTNAEIVRVTVVAGDTLTVTRAQEGTSAKALASGYVISNAITAKTLTDIEAATSGGYTLPAATTSVLGGVIVPAAGNLTVDGSGNISVAQASPSVFGVAKVDGTTITAAAGVISAVAQADPIATTTTSGDVIVPVAGGLAVDGSGNISLQGVPAAGTGAASYPVMASLVVGAKTVGITTSSQGTDVCQINIPPGITRWRMVGGSSQVGSCVMGESAANLSGATFTVWTGPNGTGSQVSTTAFAGPNGAVAVGFSATVSTFVGTANTLYVHQVGTSANNGNVSFYLLLMPIN